MFKDGSLVASLPQPFQQPLAGCKQPVISCRQPIAGCKQPVAGCKQLSTGYKQLIVGSIQFQFSCTFIACSSLIQLPPNLLQVGSSVA